MRTFSRSERHRKHQAELDEVRSWMSDVVAKVDEAAADDGDERYDARVYATTDTK